MKLVYDENMPAVEDLLGAHFELLPRPGREVVSSDLKEATALLVRSVTRVDAALLAETPVQFVGSATSGIDHVDQNWLASAEIAFTYAPGANANSVVEYVLSAIASCDDHLERLLTGGRVGIVGYGNVGRALAARLEALGIAWCSDDPWLGDSVPQASAGLEEVLGCDVVCLHPELTRDKPWPSYHLIDRKALEALSADQLLINASRGPVVDGAALLQRLRKPDAPKVVLDVWEHEPEVDPELLSLVRFGTAHIAGYSLDSKIAATRMLATALLHSLNLPLADDMRGGEDASVLQLATEGDTTSRLRDLLQQRYRIERDDELLRQLVPGEGAVGPGFDRLRREYRERRELAGSSVRVKAEDMSGIALLRALDCVPLTGEQ